MKAQKKLLWFFATTYLGSSLSTVATFLCVQPTFGTASSTAITLAVKPAANIFTGLFAPTLLRRFGLKGCLTISQWIGLIALGFLATGFLTTTLWPVLLGVVVAGSPTTLVGITMLSSLKDLSLSENEFRSYAGARDVIAGSSLFVAGLAAPLLVSSSVYVAYLMDAVTFTLALIFLPALVLERAREKPLIGSTATLWSLKSDPITQRFIVYASAPFLLVGLLPMMASSTAIPFAEGIPLALKKSLWSFEALTAVFGGFLYARYGRHLAGRFALPILTISGTWLLLTEISKNSFIAILAAFLVGLCANLAFMRLRDDYILEAGENASLVHVRSSLSFTLRNVVYGFSPLLLLCVFTRLIEPDAIYFLILLQLGLVISALLIGAKFSSPRPLGQGENPAKN